MDEGLLIAFAKFEEAQKEVRHGRGSVDRVRQVRGGTERGENMEEGLLIAFAKFYEAQKEVRTWIGTLSLLGHLLIRVGLFLIIFRCLLNFQAR